MRKTSIGALILLLFLFPAGLQAQEQMSQSLEQVQRRCLPKFGFSDEVPVSVTLTPEQLASALKLDSTKLVPVGYWIKTEDQPVRSREIAKMFQSRMLDPRYAASLYRCYADIRAKFPKDRIYPILVTMTDRSKDEGVWPQVFASNTRAEQLNWILSDAQIPTVFAFTPRMLRLHASERSGMYRGFGVLFIREVDYYKSGSDVDIQEGMLTMYRAALDELLLPASKDASTDLEQGTWSQLAFYGLIGLLVAFVLGFIFGGYRWLKRHIINERGDASPKGQSKGTNTETDEDESSTEQPKADKQKPQLRTGIRGN